MYLRVPAVVLAVCAALVLLPYVEPILPEESFIAYNRMVGPRIGVGLAVTEHLKQPLLTQDFADMHGWPALAATVKTVYEQLPPADRNRAVVFAQNYGEASAVAFFTNVPVVSGHNQYYLWGLHGKTGDVMIDINGACWHDYHLFRSVKTAAIFSNRFGMPYEDNMPIVVCRGANESLAKLWPKAKHYE